MDKEPPNRPIMNREFERDEKGRLLQVCDLCGEVRPRKTRGEGRCCVRSTHKWLPVVKKYNVGDRVVFKATGDPGEVIAKSWDSDGILLRVHFDDTSPGTWGQYHTDKFMSEVPVDA